MKSVAIIAIICFNIVAFSGYAQKKLDDVFSDKAILTQMKKVCDWQLAHPVAINERNENDWARAAFYTGVMAAYRTTHDEKYLEEAIRWSASFDWRLAGRMRHADDHAKGQTYLEIYALKKKPEMIADIINTFDSLIMDPRPGREDWWWCDALFMAPPVLARLAEATGEEKYLMYLNAMYWDTHAYLYDRDSHLFFRDKNFFARKTPNGNKTFWGRGNGWVIAGLARVLQTLPKSNIRYNDYVSLFRDMAAALKPLQASDGLWRPSLLDPEEVPHPETSASAFFCYAMAWGVNNGILDEKTYKPVVRKAWEGLSKVVTAEGQLQWVQPIGEAPNNVTKDNFQEYGAGAFLLAGSEVIKL
jgi:unsaturated rhamnogalacturonyl hydrolase